VTYKASRHTIRDIPGMDPSIADRIIKVGYGDIDTFSGADSQLISETCQIPLDTAENLIDRAGTLLEQLRDDDWNAFAGETSRILSVMVDQMDAVVQRIGIILCFTSVILIQIFIIDDLTGTKYYLSTGLVSASCLVGFLVLILWSAYGVPLSIKLEGYMNRYQSSYGEMRMQIHDDNMESIKVLEVRLRYHNYVILAQCTLLMLGLFSLIT